MVWIKLNLRLVIAQTLHWPVGGALAVGGSELKPLPLRRSERALARSTACRMFSIALCFSYPR